MSTGKVDDRQSECESGTESDRDKERVDKGALPEATMARMTGTILATRSQVAYPLSRMVTTCGGKDPENFSVRA